MVRFQCTSCDHLFMKKSDAVVCCDDRVAMARATKAKKKLKRMMRSVRVRVDRGVSVAGNHVMIARAYHPGLSRPVEVQIRYGSDSWSKRSSADAKEKARSLALAQASRSIRRTVEYD